MRSTLVGVDAAVTIVGRMSDLCSLAEPVGSTFPVSGRRDRPG